MRIKNVRISNFLNEINNKKVICFGAGYQAMDLCSKYLDIAKNIEFFVDNNCLEKEIKKIANKEYAIYPVTKLLEVKDEDIIILISTIYFEEIIKQLNNYIELKDVDCYIYSLMEIVEDEVNDEFCQLENLALDPIPKVIHYCWFGRNKKDDKIIRCMDSWEKMCPDYKIIEWNEENFNINTNQYVKEAYENKKYAFITDYVRLYVLYNQGGIYMDTDVEIIKPLDELLYVEGFTGFETKYNIPTGIIAAKKGNLWIKEQLEAYNNEKFLKENNEPILTTNVEKITQLSKEKHNFIPNGKKQILKYGMVIYPKDFFCPKSYKTGIITKTSNTYTIHHFAGSWLPKIEREKSEKLQKRINEILNNIESF